MLRGSSPRWRGKPPVAYPPHRPMRLIPALAGKTCNQPTQPTAPTAHPRAGGENDVRRGLDGEQRGSSPRWRGKRGIQRGSAEPRRLIPALAGKTGLYYTSRAMYRAHPRAGGENAWKLKGKAIVSGSSPRWRGKLAVGARRRPMLRLIPALAGKTPCRRPPRRILPAHPRAGGENVMMTSASGMSPGSSPRWRGKRGRGRVVRAPRGLIPALAGKTSRSRAGMSRPWAHPRAGGENSNIVCRAWTSLGSSPRWRGKRRRRVPRSTGGRLIPALAGKTEPSRTPSLP